jgi:hypothetical protein
MLEGRKGPTGTAVLDSAVAENTPLPKGPTKVVGGGEMSMAKPQKMMTTIFYLFL